MQTNVKDRNWEPWIILLIAIFQGFLYILVVPPWQHYDEPSHFEYAWLLANRSGFPNPGDYDIDLRRSLVESMIQYGFYERGTQKPDLQSDNPPSIGIQQLNDPPLYYLILSLPMRIVKSWGVSSQLYLGRIVTMLFSYLITILIAWGIIREITSLKNPLRWIFPISISLLPGFTDIMTSVNNDAGAIAIFSFFLWGSIRLIHRGFNWFDLIWIVGAAFACAFTKETAFVAIPLVLIVLIITLTRNLRWWIRVIAVGLILLVGLGSFVNWGEVAFWYKATQQEVPIRQSNYAAIIGRYIFQVDTGAQVAPKWMDPLVQPIPKQDALKLAGKTATLGAWMWSDKPVKVRTPVLHDGIGTYYSIVKLTEQPTFFAFNVLLPEELVRAWVSIAPKPKKNSPPAVVYLDGLLLVEGEYSFLQPPHFLDAAGNAGKWDGQNFKNLLRNGSAENGSVGIHSWLNSFGTDYFPHYARPSFILSYVLDWQGVNWHAKLITSHLFRSLWGIFGWGNVVFLGHKPYRIFLVFFLIGIVGALLWFWKKKKVAPWDLVFFLGLVIFIIWGSAFIRGVSHLPADRLALPVARYAYPAIIPTMLIPAVGYLTLSRLLNLISHKADRIFSLVYLAMFVSFDIWALVSLYRFY